MLSTYKSFHSIQILFTILLFLVHFCLVFCPDPILPDFNAPYIEPGFDEPDVGPSFTDPHAGPGFTDPSGWSGVNVKNYVEQVLNINPKTLSIKYNDHWHKSPPSYGFLQGDEALRTYAISKFHEMYSAKDFQLKPMTLDYGITHSRLDSGGETLYLLSHSKIPIYFAIGAHSSIYASDSEPLQLSFWMFEKYFPPDNANTIIGLKKHLIGVAFIEKGREIQQALLDQLKETSYKQRFWIPLNESSG